MKSNFWTDPQDGRRYFIGGSDGFHSGERDGRRRPISEAPTSKPEMILALAS